MFTSFTRIKTFVIFLYIEKFEKKHTKKENNTKKHNYINVIKM